MKLRFVKRKKGKTNEQTNKRKVNEKQEGKNKTIQRSKINK